MKATGFKFKIDDHEIIPIDLSEIDFRYFPVYKKLNKWEKKAYRRHSAINQKKKTRKFKKFLRSVYGRVQPAVHQFLISQPPIPRTDEGAALIDAYLREKFPTLVALYELRIK